MNALRPAVLLTLMLGLSAVAQAGTFVFANANRPNIIAHPRGYTGTAAGGELAPLSVCIDTSLNPAFADEAEAAVLKAVNTFNRFIPLRDNNRASGGGSDLPGNQQDFESTLLHEMGHCVGLGHPNLGSGQGLSGGQTNATHSLPGPNSQLDVHPGPDGLYGSSDDVRGDDINLYWFVAGHNDPGLFPEPIDSTTMSRRPADLPAGHAYAANADRAVMTALGYPNSESVMQQGSVGGESQRHLLHEDVRALRLARSGVDRIQGTSDDYTWKMQYVGQLHDPSPEDCNLRIRFDTTSFAVCSIAGSISGSGDNIRAQITRANLGFSASANWYFSPGENTVLALSPASDVVMVNEPLSVQVALREVPGFDLSGEPRGTVIVSDDAPAPDTAHCSIELQGTVDEIGSCQLIPQHVGMRTLSARFLGFGGWDASSDTRQILVNDPALAATTTTIVAVNPSPTEVGMSYSVSVSVQSATPTPSGTVQIDDGTGASCTQALNAGAASCTLTSTSAGMKTLTAMYAGNATHAGSVATLPHHVLAPGGLTIFRNGFEAGE